MNTLLDITKIESEEKKLVEKNKTHTSHAEHTSKRNRRFCAILKYKIHLHEDHSDREKLHDKSQEDAVVRGSAQAGVTIIGRRHGLVPNTNIYHIFHI